MDIASLKEGNRVHGIVERIVDYGAFIDLRGVVALLELKDMVGVKHPAEILTVGDHVLVEIKTVNIATERVSVRLLRLDPTAT